MSSIVLHNNNVDLFLFEDWVQFESTDNIDKYITDEIIKQLMESNFDRIFIKDNLSANYLELLGLRVAYHIRLSKELGEKRFCPIIILSDLDSATLNKFDPMARILFTKNVFIASNTKDEIEKFKTKEMKNLTEGEYREKFLNLIDIEAPKDYTDVHDITNEWAIYQWSNALDLMTPAIDINREKISSMLYFKYLTSLHKMSDDSDAKYEIISSGKKGKILYIDDEWAKGWSDILSTLLKKSSGIDFITFEYSYKDTNKFTMLKDIKEAIEKENPDVVLLDLRLSKTDHNKMEDMEQYTGIKVLKIIKEINPGIQVIMMTATRQSVILEKLYDYGILGYIKKEHPDDLTVTTKKNINKLLKLVDTGFERMYLKNIWDISLSLITKLDKDPFEQHFSDSDSLGYKDSLGILKNEAKFVFDILDGNMENKLNYALISLASSLDAIQGIFIDCIYDRDRKRTDCYYLSRLLPDNKKSLNEHILYIIDKMNHKATFKKDEKSLKKLIKARNDYIHSNNRYEPAQSTDILTWFTLLDTIIDLIENPKQRKQHKQASMNTLEGLADFRK